MNIPFVRPCMPGPARPGRGVLRALTLLAGLAFTVAAAAQGAPQLPPEVLARALALAGDAGRAVAPREARIEVVPGRLDARLSLAPCARVEPYLPSGVPAWGRTRVGLRCTDGATRWNVFLPVTVQAWAPALVSRAALPAGARIGDGQLTQGVIDWAAANSPPFAPTQTLAGRTLARAVAPGQPLREADLQPRQWFALGENVRIQASGAGFSIVGEGKALAAGVEGRAVRVRVTGERGEGGPVLLARPVGDHRVEVDL